MSLRALHATDELLAEEQALGVDARLLVTHVVAEDVGVHRVHGQQEWIGAERQD